MPKREIELGTFCSREWRLNRSATAPHPVMQYLTLSQARGGGGGGAEYVLFIEIMWFYADN